MGVHGYFWYAVGTSSHADAARRVPTCGVTIGRKADLP